MIRARTRGSSARTARSRLLVASNRLPIALRQAARGRWTSEPGSGGLVTALLPVLRNRGGMWFGWPGAAGPAHSMRSAIASAGRQIGCELSSIMLSGQDIAGYYEGFSNECVWPLFHDLPSLCNFDPGHWRSYLAVNRRFARAIAAQAAPGDFIWVHDYHLMGVGEALRALGTRSRVGFFLHIPFPSPDIFEKLPWRLQLLRALLHYDLVGLQTQHDRRNFMACLEMLGDEVRIESRGPQPTVRTARGRTTVGAFPISIDFNAFLRGAATAEVAEKARDLHRLLPRRRLVLGIDRLDYTKGIALRLRAFQELLERYPSMRGKVSLIQVVVPSRENVPEYARMKTEIEQLVGRINGAFARPGGWVPVWYEYRSLSATELVAYYRAADIALITPLKDGMNLVSKEYCACSIEEDCVLILSEFAGAAEQLGNEALLVNPHDVQGVAAALRKAYSMAPAERTARMRAMRRSIRRQDVFAWVESFLGAASARDLNDFPERRQATGPAV